MTGKIDSGEDMNRKPTRLKIVDACRAIAVLNMVLFHALFLLSREFYLGMNLQSGWLGFWGQAIRLTFLGVVGISLALSWNTVSSYKTRQGLTGYISFIKKRFKRALVVAFAAFLVTIATAIGAFEEMVWWGVLHFIAFSILGGALIVPRVILIVLSALCSWILASFVSPWGPGWLKLILWGSDSGTTLDLFPILDWWYVVALGMLIGRLGEDYIGILERKLSFVLQSKLGTFLALIGRQALLIYLIHIPFLFFLVFITKNTFIFLFFELQ